MKREKADPSGVWKSLIIGGKNGTGWVGRSICIYFQVLLKWHM